MLRYYTVEYDGYTYKRREEKEESVCTPGSKYLLEILSATEEEKEEVKKISEKISKRSKWKDLSEKQERVYSKMEKILLRLRAYTPYSTPFLNKVSKREAPEYYNLIKHPMDLGKIGKKISGQEYTDTSEFLEDLELIWKNCFEFNSTHGNVYAMYAQKMKEKSLVLLQDLNTEREIDLEGSEEEVKHFLGTEKQRKEMVASRNAILQRSSEFVTKRSSSKMGEFWRKEQEVSKRMEKLLNLEKEKSLDSLLQRSVEIEGEKVYLPEYTHFYNSFPLVYHSSLEEEEKYKDDREKYKYKEEEKNKDKEEDFSLDQLFLLSQEKKQGNRVNREEKKEKKEEVSSREHKTVHEQRKNKKEVIEKLEINKIELSLLFKKIIATTLLSVGFTSVEPSALEVLTSYILYKTDTVLSLVKMLYQDNLHSSDPNSTPDLIKTLITKYDIKSTDFDPVSFFPDSEEDTEDEDLLDLVYSDPEEIDPLDSIM